MSNLFTGKNILITGGTGSFGNAMLRKLLTLPVKEIRVFSRDEKKQDEMRKKYDDSRVKFYIGDIRDIHAINQAITNVDFIFHAAALKQVPSCEFFPMEAIKTNAIGTHNLLEAARNNNVSKVVCLSTDKAVEPINAMGLSKSLMEKIMISSSRNLPEDQVFCATRYGNVMASRGSVIPLFISQIKDNKPITITDKIMTRFMMTLDESVDLVLKAFEIGKNGDIFVQKAPAATVHVLAQAILDLYGKPNQPILIIGRRHGEKLHETLISGSELEKVDDLGRYFRIPADSRDLNYQKYNENGQIKSNKSFNNDGYTSLNTEQLDIHSMKLLLKKLNLLNQSENKF